GNTTSDGINTALGSLALNAETSGAGNTAVGRRALQSLLTGSQNTAVGHDAGFLYTGSESNNIDIGEFTGVGGESNTIHIGDSTLAPSAKCFVGGIFSVVPGAGSHTVVVDGAGQLADLTASSIRFKKDVAPIDKISEGILALKPVTFHYKSDDTNYPQFGLVAEDVAKVNPDWITRDPKGEIYGVRYETIPILLLNEFLKEHRKNEEQGVTIAQQQQEIDALKAELKQQASQIQKVSAQLELNKPAPQTVLNN